MRISFRSRYYEVIACGIGSRKGWALCYAPDEPPNKWGVHHYWVPIGKHGQ